MAFTSNSVTVMTDWWVTSQGSGEGSGRLDRATWFDFVSTKLNQNTKQVITEMKSIKKKRGFEHKILMGASVIFQKQWPTQSLAGLKSGPSPQG